ncbi:MAG TPA: ABC transporter substrate-binding protein [Anaeromyxobacteraceae bacterium]|nr:ABC transporter substrate-binding protein [Anaeromyxobacteraceae bacterium]
MTRALLAIAAALWPCLPARAGLPARFGGDLRLALPALPRDLDPARAESAADLLAARAVHATLVEADASGGLRPGLLAALPEAEPGGRAFRLRLRPGLRFHSGAPLLAADVAASLLRLASPAPASPHGWIALPVKGADAVRAGRASALAGVEVLSDLELRVELDVPFPAFPEALAALPAAVARAPGDGAGPFMRAGEGQGGLRLAAFDGSFRGRPFADALLLLPQDARRAARAMARGEIDLAARPETVPGASAATPLAAVTATWVLVGARRLPAEAAALRAALSSVDRADLLRFVRGPAAPLASPLPPALWPGPVAPPAAAPPSPPRPGRRLSLLVPSGDVARGAADRLQVKLFDLGVRVAVEPVGAEAFQARLADGDFDLALLTRTLAAPTPAAAALEVAWALGGPAAARRALERLAGTDPGAVAAVAAEEAMAVPLLATGLTASARAGLHGLRPLRDGGLDPGELWMLPVAR